MGNSDLENFIYRVCKDCKYVFEAGNKTCDSEDIENSFPKLCSNCREEAPIIQCPECENYLQHTGGCSDFVCCSYGFHGCKKIAFGVP